MGLRVGPRGSFTYINGGHDTDWLEAGGDMRNINNLCCNDGDKSLMSSLHYNYHIMSASVSLSYVSPHGSYSYFSVSHPRPLQLFAPYTYHDIGIILYGNPELYTNIDFDIFDAVHNYIIRSKRFE